ncbi:MAG: ABC transporter permease [archaeon]
MKNLDLLVLAIKHIKQKKIRSLLTILGIVIGIAAIVGILSLGQGMQKAITTELNYLGNDVIYVLPGSERAARSGIQQLSFFRIPTSTTNLNENDLKVVKNLVGVKAAQGVITGRVNIQYGGENVSLQMYGIDPEVAKEISTIKIVEGRELTKADKAAVVLGYRVAKEIFSKKIPIGSEIKIGNKSFKVVGIFERTGGSIGSMMYDNSIFMTSEQARNVMTTPLKQNEFSLIQIKVDETKDPDVVGEKVAEKLRILHRLSEKNQDFTVITPSYIQNTVSSIMLLLNVFLLGIASISLLVGAIGIANTMYASVLERTKEIGTLKAIGASSSDILKIFAFESALLGIIGGVVGIFAGFIASGILGENWGMMQIAAGRMQTYGPIITPELLIIALIISVFTAVVAGALPAKKAASLEPVEALRYE